MAHARFTAEAKQLFGTIDRIRKELKSLRDEATKINIGGGGAYGSSKEINRIATQRRAASQAIINGIKEEAAEASKGAAQERRASQGVVDSQKEKAAAYTTAAAKARTASQAIINSSREEAAAIATVTQEKKKAAAEEARLAAAERRSSQQAINDMREEASLLAALAQEKKRAAAEEARLAAAERRSSQQSINAMREEASVLAALTQEKRKAAAESSKLAAEERRASQSIINTKKEEAAQIQKTAAQRKAASDAVIRGINKETAELRKQVAAYKKVSAAAKAASAAQLEADKLTSSAARTRLAVMRTEDYEKRRIAKADEELQKRGRKFYADWAEAARLNAIGVDKFGNAINNTARATRSAAKEVGMLNKAAQRFSATLLAFGTGYLVIQGLTSAFGALKYAVIDFNDLVSRTRISFTTMFEGNVAAADELIGKLQDFAAKTSFSFTDLLPITKQMIAMGVASREEVIPALEGIGGAAAAMDVGSEGMSRIIKALGQMSMKTRASAEEINQQLAEIPIKAMKYVAEGLGVTESQAVDMMKKGMIRGKDAAAAILDGLERDYAKHLHAMEEEFSVSWNNIKDSSTIAVQRAFLPMFQQMSKMAREIAKVTGTNAFQDWAKDVGEQFTEFFGKIGSVFKFVYNIITSDSPAIAAAVTLVEVAIIRMVTIAIFGSLYSSIVVVVGWAAAVVASMATSTTAIYQFSLFASARSLWIRFQVALAFASAQVVSFAATASTSWIVAGGPLAWLVAAVAAFGIAWATNLAGIRDFTGKWARGIVESIARAYDWIAEKTGGEGGFLASTKSYLDNGGIDRDLDELKGKIVSTFGLPTFDIAGMVAKANAEMNAAMSKVRTPRGIDPISPIPEDPEKAKNKAAAIARKLEKDQLQDAIKLYDQMAKAVESSAKRQMDALTSLRDKLRDLFGSMQDALLKEGIINNPLAPMIASFEKFIKLGPRMQKTATDAAKALKRIDSERGVFQSRLDVMDGGNGSGPGYSPGGGGGTLEMARSMVGLTGKSAEATGAAYGLEWCVGFIQQVRKKLGQNPLAGGALSVSAVRAAAQKSGTAYRGTPQVGDYATMKGVGKTASHIAVVSKVNPDGTFETIGGNEGSKNNYASRVREGAKYRSDHPGVLFVRSGDAGAGKTPKFLPKNNAAAISADANDPRAFLDELMSSIDGSLSRISSLPKAWGSAVRDMAGNTARFTAQTTLANKEFQDMFRALAGDKAFEEFAAKLRVASNQLDYTVNRVRAANAAADRIRENNRAITLSRLGANPRTELEMEFTPGGALADLDEGKRNELRASTYHLMLRNARQATEDFTKSQNDQIEILGVSNKFLQENAYNSIALARAVEVARFEQEAYNQLIKDGIKEEEARLQVGIRSLAFQTAYDQQLANGAATAYAQSIRDLNNEFEALNDTSIQAIATREVMNQEDADYLTKREKEVGVLTRVRNAMRAIDIEMRNASRGRGNQARVLDQQSGLVGSGMFGADFDEQAQAATTFWTRYSELLERTKDHAYAFKAAQQEAVSETIMARTARAIQYQKDYNKALYDSASAAQLAAQKRDIYNGTVFGSVQQDQLLAYAEIEDAVRREAKERGWNNETIRQEIRLRRQQADLAAGVNRSGNQSSRNADIARQLIEIRSTYAMAQRELTGGVGQAAGFRESLRLTEEVGTALGTWVDHTEEQRAALGEIEETLRRIDQLAIQKIINDLGEQTKAMELYKFGKDRDNFLRRAELMRMPEMTGDQADQIMGMEKYLDGLRKTEEATRSWGDSVRGIFENSLNQVYETGFGGFFRNVLNGFVDLFNKISSQIISSWATRMLMNMIPGMGSFGGMITGAGSAPMSFATGISRVPMDEMPAILHRNEAVLTATQAEDWRRSRSPLNTASSGRGGSEKNVTINIGSVNTPDARTFMNDMESMSTGQGQAPSRRTAIRNMRDTVNSA